MTINHSTVRDRTRKANTWKQIAFVCLPMALAVLVAFFSPSNVLTLYPRLGSAVDIFSRLIPTINQFVGISTFPEVTRLTLSLLWVLVPFQVGLALSIEALTLDSWRFRERPLWYGFCVVSCSIAFCWFWFVAEITSADISGGMTSETLFYLMSNSPFWLGFGGAVLVFGAPILILASGFYLYFLLDHVQSRF